LLIGITQPAFSENERRTAFNALSGRFLPIWVAKDAKLFEKHNLNVPLIYVGGPLAVPTLAASEVDFALMGGSTALSGITAGMDLVMLASLMSEPDLYLVARRGIRKPKQLKGLHIGVGRFGGEPDFLVRYLLRSWGLIPDREVRISQLFGSHPERMAAVMHERVDATVITPPVTFQARKLGLELVKLTAPGDHYLGLTLVSRRNFIAKNQEATRNFLRTLVDGVRVAKSDKSKAFAALRKYTGLRDADVLNESYQEYARLFRTNLRISSESVDLMLEMMGKKFDAHRSFDNRFLDALK
jgi:ABC-type nitrate/sulfonate/bicarbonate transport system substrate-binding protein